MVLQSSVAIFQWDMHFYYFYKYATTTTSFFFLQNSFTFNYNMLVQTYPIASQAELQLSFD